MRCNYDYRTLSDHLSRGTAHSQLDFRVQLSNLQNAVERIESLLAEVKSGIKELTIAKTNGEVPEFGQAQEQGNSGTHGSRRNDAETGQLIKAGERAVYMDGGFWVGLESEQDSVQDSVRDSSEPPPVTTSLLEHTFLFGRVPLNGKLDSVMPSPRHHALLWQLYLENVDPLLKIFHVTSKTVSSPTTTSASLRCLLYAVYYAAIVSLQHRDQCFGMFQEDRHVLLDKYRNGVQSALAKADFLASPDLTILQAMAIFLICGRRDPCNSSVWALTALLIRLARRIGLHRDPEAFDLPYFEAEMRRKLWWHICILDVRTAEDENMEPSIYEHEFNTKFPAYLNDSDLHQSMGHDPTRAPRGTEMLFCLCRFEISYAMRKVQFSDRFCSDNSYEIMSSGQKLSFIDSIHKKLGDNYFQHCDTSVPICFLSETASKLILAKSKLLVHLSCRRRKDDGNDSHWHQFFKTAIEILEFTHALRSHEAYQRWVFLFQKYIDWDALAYVLLYLRSSADTELASRAWSAVDQCFQYWENDAAGGRHEHRWHRLQALRTQALVAKESLHSDADSSATLRPGSAIIELRNSLVNHQAALIWNMPAKNQSEISSFQVSASSDDFSNPTAAQDGATSISTDENATTCNEWTFDQSGDMQDIWWDSSIDGTGFNSWV